MCIALIVLLYFVIITIIILSRSHANSLQHHGQYRPTQRWLNVIFYSLFVFSLLTFEIVLTHKLDQEMASTNLMQSLHSFFKNPSSMHISHSIQSAPSASSLSSSSSSSSNQNNQPSLLQQSLQGVQVKLKQTMLNANATTEASAFNYYLETTPAYSKMSILDQEPPYVISYFVTNLPLQLAILALMLLSFNSHSGNLWWFGLRRDFCEIFLMICPLLKTYGNVQLKLSCRRDSDSTPSTNRARSARATTNYAHVGSTSLEQQQPLNQQQQPNIIVMSDNNSNEASLVTVSVIQANTNHSADLPITNYSTSMSRKVDLLLVDQAAPNHGKCESQIINLYEPS